MKLTAKEYETKRGKRPSAWAQAMAEGKPATYAEWEWLSDPNGATLAEAIEWANTRRSNPVKIMLGGTYDDCSAWV